MKKSSKKMQLNRETLRYLEQFQLEGAVGGGTFVTCSGGSVNTCTGSTTVAASGCESRCTCTSVYC